MWVKLKHDTQASRPGDLRAITSLTSADLRRLLLFPTDQKQVYPLASSFPSQVAGGNVRSALHLNAEGMQSCTGLGLVAEELCQPQQTQAAKYLDTTAGITS